MFGACGGEVRGVGGGEEHIKALRIKARLAKDAKTHVAWEG